MKDIQNINSIKISVIDDKEFVYLNNQNVAFESKLVGGISLKLASRRYDIEYRNQYIYTMVDNKLVATKVKVPMIFVQEEQLNTFKQDISEKNSYLQNVSISINNDKLAKIIEDHHNLLDLFKNVKDKFTSQDIIDYIG